MGDDVFVTRRANVCLAGGSLTCMLGITKEFNDLDLFIEYDEMTFQSMAYMKFYVNGPNFLYVWVSNYIDDDSYNMSNNLIHLNPLTNQMSTLFETPNPNIIFRNQNNILIKIVSVLHLNPNIPIVQHWKNKYKQSNCSHLPQIIFYKSA